MVKALVFKGEKRKSKKRKIADSEERPDDLRRSAPAPAEVDEAKGDDSWVSAEAPTDIGGPVVIVLPSTKPTCLACDASGEVFASELENIVEGDPASAEPHDVRQVWIANRVTGTETISMKSHHGCFLSCDQIGVLTATRQAISPEESFTAVLSSAPPDVFHLQTARMMFLGLVEDSKTPVIRGDFENISFNTGIRIRMQTRFKPQLRARKQQQTQGRISRKELEEAVGRRLDDDEVRRLKKARSQGNYHETLLDIRVSGKHDKYS